MLAGSTDLIGRAWRVKHLFGGAMRQAGIVASAGVYALDNHVERLAEDHARARVSPKASRLLVSRSTRAGRDELRPGRHRTARNVTTRCAGPAPERGVGLSATIHPTVIRAVTHLEIGDPDIEDAIEIVAATFAGSEATARRA